MAAGGMRRRGDGPTMEERLALTRGAQQSVCPMRHVWVADAVDRVGVKRPGLLVEWRRTSSEWQALVLYAAELRPGHWAVVQEWVGGALVTPA